MKRLAQSTFHSSRSAAFRIVLGLITLGFLVALPSASSTKVRPKLMTDLRVHSAAASALPLSPLLLTYSVDRNDDDPLATLCTPLPNDCSLRGAIIASNANLGADVIVFDSATNGTPFNLTAGPADNEFAGTGAIQASGDLDIVDHLTITGNGAALTVIDGNNLDRIIDVNNFNGTNSSTRRALTVVIDGVTLRNGDAKQVQVDPGPPAQFFNHSGGAIRFDGIQAATTVRGSLTITNSIITNNRAAATGGGVQLINGSLTVNSTQVLNNQATTSSAGGILYNAGTTAGLRTLTITNSTISNNKALTATLGSGGGVSAVGTATININNNTISGNQAGANGGGIAASVSTTTTKSYSKNKFTGNSANQGGAVFNSNGSLTFDYNLVVGNSTAALASSSFHHTTGTAAVSNNWWGCNEGPNVGSSLCDKMTGATSTNHLVLNHAATPNSIPVNTPTSLQADFYTNSSSAVVLPTNLVALEGRPIVFNNAVLGTISGADTQISNGKANATYTSGAVGGIGSADAKVDHATVTAYISIQQAPDTTVDPTDQTVCEGDTATFTAASAGIPPPSAQWQVSTDGGANFTDIPGATNNILSFTASASQNGNQYRAVFTNVAGSDTTNAATLTVNTDPTVTTNPADVSVCEGATASFTAAGNGSPAPTVQWQVSTGGPFTDLPGETSTTLSFTATVSHDGNRYRAVFTNTCGSATSTAATLNVNANTSATTPNAQTVCQGATANFSTTASGDGPFSYQWKLDGSDISGATNSSVAIDTTSVSVGNHTVEVVVTGACNSVTKTSSLTVQENTAASTPGDQTVCQGATANFSTTASGTNLSYQWKLDGSNIPGATGSSVAIDTTSATVGNHSVEVVVSGSCGTVTKSASLTVQANTTATTPVDQTECQGATANFSTTASGSNLSYQWKLDGNNIAGATSSSVAIDTSSVSVGNHTVEVVVSGSCGTVTRSASLTVQENTSASTPGDQDVCQGTTANFSTTASGTNLSYQWKLDGSNIAGATGSSVAIDTTSISLGNHTVEVVVSGSCGTVTKSATLTVRQNTTATTPGDQIVCQGANATFSTTANGDNLTLQWKLDGSNIAGANGSSVVIATGLLSAGNHTVEVVASGSCGTVTRSATLTVHTAPAVTLNPQSQTVTNGGNVTFTAAASGQPTPTVQWQVSTNGGGSFSNIPGATSTSLTFATNSSQNGNQYRAVFTNECGTEITTAATLTTCTPAQVTSSPTSVADACVGSVVTFSASASGFPTPTVQWQVSTNGGGTWTNISGATSTSLSVTASVAVRNNQYRAVFTNDCGTATTAAAILGVDTIAPVITINNNTITLWPPNHSYHTINIADLVASASDNCSSNLLSSVVISSISSDESENGNGDGNTFNDIVIAADCKTVQLRAERQGGGNGRVYRINFTVTDSAGNTSTATGKVSVPKNANSTAVDDGPASGYTVTSACP